MQNILSPLTRPFYRGIGHILMFHRIRADRGQIRVPGAANIEYPPERFAALLDHLAENGYRFVSLDELAEILEKPRKTPEFIAVTFDDGYADNFTTAYPILKDRKIPFAIYVTSSFPDHDAVIWWYILEDMLNRDDLIAFEYRQRSYRFDTSRPEERQQFGRTVRSLMKSASKEELDTLVKNVFVAQGIDPRQKVRELSLSWAQLKELSGDPLATIGTHTKNHLLLKELPVETAREEISWGRVRLEEKLGAPINHFAFPFGGANAAGAREFQLVREAGFKTGVTTRMANIFPEHRGHMEALPRLDMGMFPDFSGLKEALDGWVPARMNRFKRVVTE